MQFSASILVIIAAVYAQPSIQADPICNRYDDSGLSRWEISADKFADGPGTCAGISANLWPKFLACEPSGWGCGNEDKADGKFLLRFKTGTGCNGGMINSAWWEQTRNSNGGLSC